MPETHWIRSWHTHAVHHQWLLTGFPTHETITLKFPCICQGQDARVKTWSSIPSIGNPQNGHMNPHNPYENGLVTIASTKLQYKYKFKGFHTWKNTIIIYNMILPSKFPMVHRFPNEKHPRLPASPPSAPASPGPSASRWSRAARRWGWRKRRHRRPSPQSSPGIAGETNGSINSLEMENGCKWSVGIFKRWI